MTFHDHRYLGFFACFNATRYYEAHDVLEGLWLETRDDNRDFFKALIQIAGAYVHLQAQQRFPGHPFHATRMRPAARLLRRAACLLEPFEPAHGGLDVRAVRAFCRDTAAVLAGPGGNPWRPDAPPQLVIRPAPEGS